MMPVPPRKTWDETHSGKPISLHAGWFYKGRPLFRRAADCFTGDYGSSEAK
jgi:hypothetical protein